MPTKRLVVRVPDDVKAWLEQQALYYGGTLGSEVSKSCRQRMESEVLHGSPNHRFARRIAEASAIRWTPAVMTTLRSRFRMPQNENAAAR